MQYNCLFLVVQRLRQLCAGICMPFHFFFGIIFFASSFLNPFSTSIALRRVSCRSAISCKQAYREALSISRFKSSALNDSRFTKTTNSLILAVSRMFRPFLACWGLLLATALPYKTTKPDLTYRLHLRRRRLFRVQHQFLESQNHEQHLYEAYN